MWALRSDVAARISSAKRPVDQDRSAYRRRPWQRLGGSPRSSTRSIPRSFADAERGRRRATSRGSPAGSTTSPGSGWTPCGCPRSSGPRWPTMATTSPITATSTPCSGRSPTSTTCSPSSTDGACGCCSTSCRTTPRRSTRGSSRAARLETNPKRDWYVWRDPAPGGGPPNNWRRRVHRRTRRGPSTRRPASTTSTASSPSSLTSNWSNPEVEEAMHDVVRFWLDRGIDGFRIDVVHLIGKDPGLADDPPERAQWPHVVLNDHDSTHVLLRRLRRAGRLLLRATGSPSARSCLLDAPGGDLLRRRRRAAPRVQLPALLRAVDRGPRGAQRIDRTHRAARPRGAWPTWVLGNHDVPRLRTRLRQSDAACTGGRRAPAHPAGHAVPLRRRRARSRGRGGAAARTCSIPEVATDVAAPIPWDPEPPHGWDGATPWLPFPPHAGENARRRSATIPRRRSGCITTCSPFVASPRRCGRGRSRGSTRPTACSSTSASTDDDRRDRVRELRVRATATVDVQGTIQVSSVPGRAGKQFDGRPATR